MALTLSRLLSNTESFDIKTVAGQGGMNALVRWIHMVEDIEVPGFLHGNELVFTTGIAQKGTQWLTPFAKSLKSHGAIGIVINIGPYIAAVPDELKGYCDAEDFPLFTIPWEKRLTDVTYDLCRRLIASEENETGIAAVFRAMLLDKPTREGDLRLLAKRGFYSSVDYTVMLLSAYRNDLLLSGDEWDSIRFRVQETILQCVNKSVFCFTQDNYFAVIGGGVFGTEMEQCVEVLDREVFSERHETNLYAGISDTVSGFQELYACFKQAAAAVSTAKHEKISCQRYSQLGIQKLIYAVNNTAVLSRFTEDVLGKILSYDLIHGTDYAAILEIYIRHNGSVQQAAEEAGTHRNTINNKIKTIRDQFGFKLDYSDIANLKLAFAIRDVCQKNF